LNEVIHKYIKKHPERFIREKNTNKIWDKEQGAISSAKKCKHIPNKEKQPSNCLDEKYGPRILHVCRDEKGNINRNFNKSIS